MSEKSYAVPSNFLNLNGTVSVIYKLARWHASSMYMASETKDQSFYKSGSVNAEFKAKILANFEYFVGDLKNWNLDEVYVKKLTALMGTFEQRFEQVFQSTSSDGFRVLNHGALHYKNLMVQQLNERTDALFVSIYCYLYYS